MSLLLRLSQTYFDAATTSFTYQTEFHRHFSISQDCAFTEGLPSPCHVVAPLHFLNQVLYL